MKCTYKGREVEVLQHGFDIAIIMHESGEQELVRVSNTNLNKRSRPKRYSYKLANMKSKTLT